MRLTSGFSGFGGFTTFHTNGAERMRLNSAGNLGLGVVPPSNDFTGVLQVRYAGHGLTGRDTGDLVMSMNANHNGGGWQYGNTGAPASLYLQSGGAHIWVNAASGTAGNAITFAETMRITAAGNLGIGTASPSQPLTVQTGSVYAASFKTTVTSSASTAIAIGTFGSGTPGAGGDVGIRCYHHHAATAVTSMAFEVNGNTEAMRIDSSGSLLVGTTTSVSGERFTAQVSGAVNCIVANNADTAGTNHTLFYGRANGADRFYVLGNGNVQNSNNSYGALSDVKLKENIVDATPKLGKLMSVRVVNYNLKNDPELTQIGVIAQELEKVFPGMIEETPDRDAAGLLNGESTKSVKYSVFVPMLIKALQEANEKIDTLAARVAQFEGN
jgi:hypothetical protein